MPLKHTIIINYPFERFVKGYVFISKIKRADFYEQHLFILIRKTECHQIYIVFYILFISCCDMCFYVIGHYLW